VRIGESGGSFAPRMSDTLSAIRVRQLEIWWGTARACLINRTPNVIRRTTVNQVFSHRYDTAEKHARDHSTSK
jgi:hypothetical protein